MDKQTSKYLERSAIEWRNCEVDMKRFIETFCMLKNQIGGRPMPFKLWPCQIVQLSIWIGNKLCITLKTRQIGISWLSAAFALHQMLFRPNFTVMVLSRKESDAIKYLEKIKYMYDLLPDLIKNIHPIKHQNRLIMEIEYSKVYNRGGSIAFAESSNPEAGRGHTLNLIIFDECAFIPDAESVWSAAEPTIETTFGQAIFISTANGYDKLFQPTWANSESNENGFTRNFIGWDGDPKRDNNWYNVKRKQAESQGRLREMRQEYPRTSEEAFIVSGDTFFTPELIQSYLELPVKTSLRGNITIINKPQFNLSENGNMRMWKRPQSNQHYCAGIDSAEGVSEGDYSVVAIYDRKTKEQVAEWSGRVDTETFSQVVFALGRFYNYALLNIEMNSCGESILNFIHRQKHYPNLYRQWRYDELQRKKVKKIGWRTTTTSKRLSLDALESFLREREIKPHSRRLFEEMKTFVIKQTEWGNYTYGASGKNKDDRIMAHSIAAIILQDMPFHEKRQIQVRPQWSNRLTQKMAIPHKYNESKMFL